MNILVLHFLLGLASTKGLLAFQNGAFFTETSLARASRLELRSSETGIYVHIPYCRRRCRYCNFAIVPIGNNAVIEDAYTPSFLEMDANYTSAVMNDINQYASKMKNERVSIQSIYFGGGTPSLAPVETLRSILSTLRNKNRVPFDVDTDAEISIEMDPGTFSREKLLAIREMGFNRISLGVQSFDDMILEAMGRTHRTKDTIESISLLNEVYGPECNYSIDLISGVPGLSLAKWSDTLEQALKLEPCPVHLSVYDLQVEKETVFGRWYAEDDVATKSTHYSTKGELAVPKHVLKLPSESDAAFMYKYASAYLRLKGFEHYEISSFALKSDHRSFRSRHNQIYWALDGQWYAIGLGSTSFLDGRIVARPRTLADYRTWVDAISQASTVESSDVVSEIDLLLDTVLKRLRTAEGLSLNWIKDRFGQSCVTAVMRGAELGLELNLVEMELSSNTIRLVDPSGFLYSNSIISSIFVELEAECVP